MKPREMGIKWSFAKFEEIIALLSLAKWTGYFDGRVTRRRTMWVHTETYDLLMSHGIYIWLCKPCAAIKIPKESGWSFTMSHSHLFLLNNIYYDKLKNQCLKIIFKVFEKYLNLFHVIFFRILCGIFCYLVKFFNYIVHC